MVFSHYTDHCWPGKHTHTHQIHTLQLPGAETLFISSNAYIKMEMCRIFSTKKWKKQGVDTLTGTPVQYNAIQCNCLTRQTTVRPSFCDCFREMLIHLAHCSLCVVLFWIVFYCSRCFCCFWNVFLVFVLLCAPLILLSEGFLLCSTFSSTTPLTYWNKTHRT